MLTDIRRAMHEQSENFSKERKYEKLLNINQRADVYSN